MSDPLRLSGVAASPGLGVGPAYVLRAPNLGFAPVRVGADAATELERLAAALGVAGAELQAIQEQTAASLGEEHAAIFEAHVLMLADPEFVGGVQSAIEGGADAPTAVMDVSNGFIEMFSALEDEYMRERAADLLDVRNRVLGHLLGTPLKGLSEMKERGVLVAEDLSPSDTATLNRDLVAGIVTAVGGRTSHSAIMARGLGLPAVVGAGEDVLAVASGVQIIADGDRGEVIVNPTPAELEEAGARSRAAADARDRLMALVGQEGRTVDGRRIELAANIGSPADLGAALEFGAEGVGLYRTEFLYMAQNRLPTEEEQFQAYKTVLEGMGGRPVVIRTLDIGGDKAADYLNLPKEENPFLGFRAIRLCLARPDIFRMQLRALLRASVHGNLHIMFPFISTVEEMRQAIAMLKEERVKLKSEGVSVMENIPVGIMVEVPAVAVHAEAFAREADFFSIGSNDLIGYAMAADRMNEQVAGLYQPLNPSVLRMIALACEGAKKHNRWVGVCGEMAGDPLAMPLLVGLGVTELSMSAPSLLSSRERLLRLDAAHAARVAEEVLSLSTPAEVEALVRANFDA